MTSVLDQMVAGITERKQAKATVLTPVGTEKHAALPDDTGMLFSNKVLADHAASLRRFAEDALRVAEGIDVMLGVPEAVERKLLADTQRELILIANEDNKKAADRAKADAGDARAQARVDAVTPETVAAEEESLKQRMKRLTAEAQAHTFTAAVQADAPAPEPVITPAASGSPVPGWTCPIHGDTAIKQLTSKKGREYRACSTCNQFQKS